MFAASLGSLCLEALDRLDVVRDLRTGYGEASGIGWRWLCEVLVRDIGARSSEDGMRDMVARLLDRLEGRMRDLRRPAWSWVR